MSLTDTAHQLVKMSTGTYTGSLSIAGKTVYIHGYGATLNASSGVLAIRAYDGAHLKLFGLNVVNPATDTTFGVTISCDKSSSGMPAATVELEDATIDSGNIAFYAQPCTASIIRSRIYCRTATAQNMLFLPTSNLTVDRSVMDGGDGIWVEGSNSVARITNSVITNQSGPEGAFVGSSVFGQGAGSMFVSFSTVINSAIKCGTTPPRCAGGTDVGSCVDNTIVFNGAGSPNSDTVQGGCRVDYAVVYPQSTSLGSNNQINTDPMFNDSAAGDYHLKAGSTAVDAGDPNATNTVDYDGISRPQGTRSDIGAFEFKP
jgi:hypothetical protein